MITMTWRLKLIELIGELIVRCLCCELAVVYQGNRQEYAQADLPILG